MGKKVTTEQIPVIAARVVEFQEEFGLNGLSVEDGQFVIQNPREAVKLMALAVKNRQESVGLFKKLETVVVPHSTEEFIVRNKFIVNTGDDADVKISGLGDYFCECFLGKTEESTAKDSAIDFNELLKASVDGPIIEGLGEKEKVPTTLREVYFLMKHGKLDKNKWYIFYIPDVNGILRAVDVHWDGGGWDVCADSVGIPSEWGAGGVVASRNSLAA